MKEVPSVAGRTRLGPAKIPTTGQKGSNSRNLPVPEFVENGRVQ